MNNKSEALVILAFSVMLTTVNLPSTPVGVQVYTAEEHVYYGYVPPSTDFATGTAGGVDELIRGTKINYTVPSSSAILDVVGLEDDTSIEIWDIYANQRIYSATLDRLERKFFYMPVGAFFKITSSRRIAALLTGGGFLTPGGEHDLGGTSTFYPAVTGGFRGKEFIFNAAPGTHPSGYSKDKVGHNFYLMAFEETDWTLVDSIGVWSTSEHLRQRGTRTAMIQSRINHLGYHGGAGSDVVFRLTATGDVEVSSCAGLGDFVAVPAITGGYVGRVFCAPVAVTFEEPGRTAAFIVVPLEEGQVTIYDKELSAIATRSFTTSDVEDVNLWYHELGIGRFDLIAESTGDITFMVGKTEGTAEVGYLGDDITFMGSKPGQETRFYAPTMAVVFAPETLTVTIDGGAPTQMERNDFRLLESGVHSVFANGYVIIEILAAGSGWNNWGSYLIEPADMDVSFDVPEGFLSKPVDYTLYVTAAAVAVIAVVAVFVLRRRRASRL